MGRGSVFREVDPALGLSLLGAGLCVLSLLLAGGPPGLALRWLLAG